MSSARRTFQCPWQPGFLVLALGFFLVLSPYSSSEAKSKRVSVSPVKISEVVLSPNPFILGKNALKLAMLVELPAYLNGANVLEVSAMITSPTRRSISFVAHRRSVDDLEPNGKNLIVPVMLVWDGKDQNQQLVPDGSYFYELQAKLMADEGYGPRTKIVSHRIHGTLEALAYAGEVVPPLAPEPDIPGELEILPDGDSQEEDVQVMEEGLKESDDPVVPGEDNLQDAADILPAEGGLPDSQGIEPEGNPALPDHSLAEPVTPGATTLPKR